MHLDKNGTTMNFSLLRDLSIFKMHADGEIIQKLHNRYTLSISNDGRK